ncbi:DegT/DnrJ/EryC1/StrS family aminotransferase [Candidatus Woesearchaeota archaeon]|nr:DegT/DnrJ/EryC1/StrS family aminotransferase [Candidatus Woesearchaeota archaeon]
MRVSIAKPFIGEEEKKAVLEVLDSRMLAQGEKVKKLEQEFAKLCGAKNAVAVSNGTAALHACLHAVGVKAGDEVITTPFSFVATANAILMMGAKPVFVDVDEKSFNIDASKIEEKVTPRTRAIIPVDLYGLPHDYDKLKKIADKHGLYIVEDACQAVNASLDGVKAGCLGDIAAFSLYATKNIVSGEGGMVTTDNPKFAEKVKRFRHHGQDEKDRYIYHELGYNYRMTDLQAAIALCQLAKVEDFTAQRIRNAKKLSAGLKGLKGVVLPVVSNNACHVFHQYTIKVGGKMKRDELAKKLDDNEIGTGIFYPKPLHLHPHLAKFGYKAGDFPVAEKLCSQVLSLPVHPLVSSDDIDRIIEVVRNA